MNNNNNNISRNGSASGSGVKNNVNGFNTNEKTNNSKNGDVNMIDKKTWKKLSKSRTYGEYAKLALKAIEAKEQAQEAKNMLLANRDEIHKYQDDIEKWSQRIDDLNKEIKKYASEIKELASMNELLASVNKEQDSKIKELDSMNKEQDSKIKELDSMNKEQDSKIKEQGSKIKEQSSLIKEQGSKIKEQSSLIKEQDSKINNVTKDNKTLTTERDLYKQKYEELEVENAKNTGKADAAIQIAQKVEEELNRQAESITADYEVYDDCTEELSSRAKMINRFRKQIKEYEKDIALLKHDISIGVNVEGNKKDIDFMEGQKRYLNNQIKGFQSGFNTCKNKKTIVSETIDAKRTKYEELQDSWRVVAENLNL